MFEIKKLVEIRNIYNNSNLYDFIKAAYGINFFMFNYIITLNKFNKINNIKVKNVSDSELMSMVYKIININLIYNYKLNISINIENYRKLKNYKYIRHLSNLPVNGQRTHTNRKTKRKYFSFLNKNNNKYLFKF